MKVLFIDGPKKGDVLEIADDTKHIEFPVFKGHEVALVSNRIKPLGTYDTMTYRIIPLNGFHFGVSDNDHNMEAYIMATLILGFKGL